MLLRDLQLIWSMGKAEAARGDMSGLKRCAGLFSETRGFLEKQWVFKVWHYKFNLFYTRNKFR